tara:strand:+ start:58 stop:411 length:354 start_codon:yes stop_codon:yes gene_type:complete
MTEELIPPPPDPGPPPKPPGLEDFEEICAQDDTEREAIKDTQPPHYRISEITKSKTIDKKVVLKFNYITEIWKPTEEERGKSVASTNFLQYAYDDDIGPQEINVVGSRYIDTEIPKA